MINGLSRNTASMSGASNENEPGLGKSLLVVILMAAGYHLLIGGVALGVGIAIDYFSSISWVVATAIAYFAIRLCIEGIDLFADLLGVRCPSCKRRIKTSRPIKCEECGGAAMLARKKS